MEHKQTDTYIYLLSFELKELKMFKKKKGNMIIYVLKIIGRYGYVISKLRQYRTTIHL